MLHGLLADLEKQLAAPFKGNYNEIVAQARSRLEHLWEYPTLNG